MGSMGPCGLPRGWMKNVRYSGGAPLENATVKQVIADAEKELEGKGRIVIRPSGTEPLIRCYAEASTQKDLKIMMKNCLDLLS